MIPSLRTRWRGLLVIATAVLMTSALVVGGVLAQTPPPTPTPGAAAPAKPGAAAPNHWQDFTNRLATKLGIDPAKLTTAMKDVAKEMVDEAVAAGRISKEAGDKIKQRIDQGQGPILPPHGRGGQPKVAPGTPGGPAGRPGPALAGLRDGVKAVADFLAVTPEKLLTELRASKSLATIATEHGKTREQLKAFLIGQVEARLKQAVADSKMPQSQADQMLERFKQHVDQMIDRTMGPGAGPRGNRPGGPNAPAKPSGNA